MTLVVAALTLAVVLLAVLVAGLLRSHADILRRLHELGIDLDPGASATTAGGEHEAEPQTPRAADAPATARPAHDVVGSDLTGGSVAFRVTGVPHDTLLLFLSSGCATCATFWDELADRVSLPQDTRLVVVAQDAVEESPARLAELTNDDLALVLSSQAWRDHGVPGSPFAVHIDGPSGRIVGQGTGTSYEQVARLMADATGDVGYLGGQHRGRKARPDRMREQDVDRALLDAGIAPADPRLYQPLSPSADDADAVTP